MAGLEGASESLEENEALPLPAWVCGNPRMPSSGLAPKMSLQLRVRSRRVGRATRSDFPELLRTRSWDWS